METWTRKGLCPHHTEETWYPPYYEYPGEIYYDEFGNPVDAYGNPIIWPDPSYPYWPDDGMGETEDPYAPVDPDVPVDPDAPADPGETGEPDEPEEPTTGGGLSDFLNSLFGNNSGTTNE